MNNGVVDKCLYLTKEWNPAVLLGTKNQRVAVSLPVLAAVTSSAQHPWIQVIHNNLAGTSILFLAFIFQL